MPPHPSHTTAPVALHTEGVDRNALGNVDLTIGQRSPSTRRAWIEMFNFFVISLSLSVALHTEGVDRNHIAVIPVLLGSGVALHTEGVDRNHEALIFIPRKNMSPSTRRAWIEISRLWLLI